MTIFKFCKKPIKFFFFNILLKYLHLIQKLIKVAFNDKQYLKNRI